MFLLHYNDAGERIRVMLSKRLLLLLKNSWLSAIPSQISETRNGNSTGAISVAAFIYQTVGAVPIKNPRKQLVLPYIYQLMLVES
jgi:hypothetical protein